MVQPNERCENKSTHRRTQNTTIVDGLNGANSAYQLLNSYNADGVPSGGKVVFGVHESGNCNPPGVQLQVQTQVKKKASLFVCSQVYQQNHPVAFNITNVPVMVDAFLSIITLTNLQILSAMPMNATPPCPPTVQWIPIYKGILQRDEHLQETLRSFQRHPM